jgi:ABC-type lipoprotein export system ATPase subunit
LVEFARDGGAVLLVTHNPQAAAYAHRTVHMRAGTVCDGPENAE